MSENKDKSKIIDVFIDVEAHRLTADIVKKHSTNRNDIREVALKGLNLEWCRNIVELGCGFGFFTEALKGKVHPEAVVTGVDVISDYKSPFLEACKKAGVKGVFTSSGASVVKDLEEKSVDLVICSYSLYFFPEIIPDISRILKKNGLLVATVHNKENMGELVHAAKDVLAANGMLQKSVKLPIEILISRFSSESGYETLSSWFQDIRTKNYVNTLIFKPGDLYFLLEYFSFKQPLLLLSGTHAGLGPALNLLKIHLEKLFTQRRGNFTISKDDTVFVCSKPLYGRGT
ncbi:MAG: class I SAM-dependent methyltransferase [Syntrophobacterales bacterium]|nr:class I SAM-dependent methyltransferase [Syntrophobacterales bacterium]